MGFWSTSATPQAHEYDAERAVRAGLELIVAVTGLKTHAVLQTRVGITTGLVVVDAFHPIITQMERSAGLTHDDTTQAKLNKLDVLLARGRTPPQDAALLADMVSLPNDGRYPTLELAPQQRRQKTLEALTARLDGLTQSNPVLMIFEDVHWIDPTSLEVLGRTIDRMKNSPGCC